MPDNLADLNRAFWELGLRFSWDEKTWASLAAFPDLGARLAHYLAQNQPHLLGVYDVDFLRCAIEARLAHPEESRMGMEAHKSF